MAIDPRIPLAVTPPEWNPLSFMEQRDRSRSSKLLQENQQVQNDLQKTAYADNMLARAADQGKDNPEAWDQAMTALAEADVPGAAEQIGKWSRPYAEQFAQRGRMTSQGYVQQEMNAAAAPKGQAGAPQAGGQPDPFGGKSNQEVAKNLEGVQLMLQPLAGGAVRNKADLDTLVDKVVEAGHPEAARFKGMFSDGPLFNEQVKGLYQKLKQTADAAQQRLSAGGVGAPPEPQPTYSTAMSEAGPVIQTSPLDGSKPSFEFAPLAGSADPAFLPKPSASGLSILGGGGGAPGEGGVDPNDAYLRAMAFYRVAPPSAGRNPAVRAEIMRRILQINPEYRETEYPLVAKARERFATGIQGNAVRSINTSVNHLATMENMVTALNNSDYPAFNKWANWFAEQTGQPAPTNIETAGSIVGSEVVKGIVGGQSALADREEARMAFERARSPAQLMQAIYVTKELMAGQLIELKRQYERTTHMTDFEEAMLSPEARKQLSHLVPAEGGASHATGEDDTPGWAK